jgi:hypothetical protein
MGHLYLKLFCYRKFLLDAMPLIRTAHGVAMMMELFKSGEITVAHIDSWLTSIAFQRKPTLDMMSSVLVWMMYHCHTFAGGVRDGTQYIIINLSCLNANFIST